MILHFAKENDFKVSQTCLPSKFREENTLGTADCLTLASASFCQVVVEAGLLERTL